jgi:NADH dehydrogenase (ubiquinone) Fe-S protein 5
LIIGNIILQRARAKAIEQEFLRKAEAAAKDGRNAADVLADGAIVGLGIIQQSQADKKS